MGLIHFYFNRQRVQKGNYSDSRRFTNEYFLCQCVIWTWRVLISDIVRFGLVKHRVSKVFVTTGHAERFDVSTVKTHVTFRRHSSKNTCRMTPHVFEPITYRLLSPLKALRTYSENQSPQESQASNSTEIEYKI